MKYHFNAFDIPPNKNASLSDWRFPVIRTFAAG